MNNVTDIVEIIADSLSPILSAVAVLLITKANERKTYRDKFFYEQLAVKRIDHIEQYISYINGRILRKEDRDVSASARNEIYLYIDSSLHHYVDGIDNYLTQSKFNDAAALLLVLCKKLNING